MSQYQQNIVNAIDSAIKGETSIEWHQLSAAIEAQMKIRSGGWMTVRNLLQGTFINTGIMTRTDDVHTETYIIDGDKL